MSDRVESLKESSEKKQSSDATQRRNSLGRPETGSAEGEQKTAAPSAATESAASDKRGTQSGDTTKGQGESAATDKRSAQGGDTTKGQDESAASDKRGTQSGDTTKGQGESAASDKRGTQGGDTTQGQGESAEQTKTKIEQLPEKDVQPEQLPKELQQDVQSARKTSDDIGEKYGKKAAASTEGGEVKKSGFHDEKTIQAVREKSKEIGHEPRTHKLKDQGEPGRYNLSHAEKKVSVTDPGKPIGESNVPMCSDCKGYFSKLAQHENKTYAVADPNYTRIFYADGRIDRVKK